MVVRRWLHRIAAAAPVPVIVVTGAGGRDRTRELRLRPELEVVDSPRHAVVLLVVGTFDSDAAATLGRLHDQLPHPRAALWWQADGDDPPPLAVGELVGPTEDVVEAIAALHRGLFVGTRPTSAAVLPDVDPNPWRGVGPFGQGGKGMTGGTPYGRELTGRAPDRDGLELDQLSVTVGPWWAGIPAGLVLDLKVQGDVIQDVIVRRGPLGADPGHSVFHRALVEEVAVADLELARARHHLCWASDLLRLLGLAAQADRVLALATPLVAGASAADLAAASALAQRLGNARRFRHPLRGVGRLTPESARRVGGPVARASGIARDARTTDPAYLRLRFKSAVAVDVDGDALSRWRIRMREVVESLDLASAAAAAVPSPPRAEVESPSGTITRENPSPTVALAALVPDLLRDLEWGDAMVALASLDLDPVELPVPVPTGDTAEVA